MYEDSYLKRAGLTTPEKRTEMGTSWMGLLMQEELKKNPGTFTIDPEFKAAGEAAKKQREINAKNVADKPKKPILLEYASLRAARFRLTEQAKDTETYTNIMLDQARGTKERVTALLKRKRAAREAGQVHDERSCEKQVQALETEIADFEKNAEHGRKNNKAAKAGLAAFEQANGARLAELEKELDA